MNGKSVPIDGNADIDLEKEIPTLYMTGPMFLTKRGVAKAVLLDHDRFMELYNGAHRTEQPKPYDRLKDELNQHMATVLKDLAPEDAPTHLVQGVRRAAVGGSLAILGDVLKGWSLAPHEDGSGDFGLYHTCDPASAYARVDATDMNDLVNVVRWHQCPPASA